MSFRTGHCTTAATLLVVKNHMQRRWTNRYIELIDAKSESILNFDSAIDSPQLLESLRSRLSAYPQRILELCSGSGGHLIELALRNPTKLCIGVELRYKRLFRTVEKAERMGVRNLILLRMNAANIGAVLEKESIEALHINFPDPWDKRRWLKHRLITPKFLELVFELLKPEGLFSYKTDHKNYFEETVAYLQNAKYLQIQTQVSDLHQMLPGTDNISSEFELLFRSNAVPVYYLRAKKLVAC